MTSPRLRIVSMRDPSADECIAAAFGRQPILIQLPSVYAIFAPATESGAASLDRCKLRKPGKYYGAGVGDPRAFFNLAPEEPLSRYLLEDKSNERLRKFSLDLYGTFIRLTIGPKTFESKVVCGGTFQGLLYSGVLAEKMQLMERLTAAMSGKLFGKDHGYFCAPIGSSCNMSGDPAGSITTRDKALAFGRDRGVELCLTLDNEEGQGGSQTILGLNHGRVEIHRDGPGSEKSIDSLQRWLRQADQS